MLKKHSTAEWIQLTITALFIMYLGHFFSLRLADHLVNASQSHFRCFSRAYIHYFSKIDNDTRVNGHTPIYYAISSYGVLDEKKVKNLKPLIDVLKKKGVDINATNAYGLTSYHYAIMNEDPLAVQLLIDEKAIVNQPIAVDNMDQLVKPMQIAGMTPLRYLHERQKQNLVKDPEKVSQIEALLVANGATDGAAAIVEKAAASQKPARAHTRSAEHHAKKHGKKKK
jgi:hypothetical protein